MAFFFSWELAGAVAVVLAVWQVFFSGFICSFLSANHDENQNIELKKSTTDDL